MSNYCDYNDVGVLLNKTFDATTTPASTQITAIITQITSEIDTVLCSIGITAQPTDANILGMLKKFCSFGSAGITGISYLRNNTQNVSGTNAEWYYNEYKEFLKQLREDPELLGITTDAESLSCSNHVIDGTYTEDEIEDLIIDDGEYEY